MKKINMAICCTLLAMGASAQEPVHPQKDQQEYAGYTIRVLPARGGYGYDVLKGKLLIIHQTNNPFTMAPNGLSRKEHVYKLAQWQIDQLSPGLNRQRPSSLQRTGVKAPPALGQKPQLPGSPVPRINQPLSKDIAKELQIDMK